MPNLADIRSALASQIRDVFPDTQVTGYNLPNAFAPAFEVELDRIVYDGAMASGLAEAFFTIRGFASGGTDVASQMRLDPWLMSAGGSLKDAIDSDRTLGGTVMDSRLISLSKIAVFSQDRGVTNFFGAEWTLRVLVSGL